VCAGSARAEQPVHFGLRAEWADLPPTLVQALGHVPKCPTPDKNSPQKYKESQYYRTSAGTGTGGWQGRSEATSQDGARAQANSALATRHPGRADGWVAGTERSDIPGRRASPGAFCPGHTTPEAVGGGGGAKRRPRTAREPRRILPWPHDTRGVPAAPDFFLEPIALLPSRMGGLGFRFSFE